MRTSARTLIRLVELVVVFGEGVAKIIPIEWRRGMTVLEALRSAELKLHGVSFKVRGTGPRAFITEIDGETCQNNAYGWVYSINGEMPEVGCGTYVLKPSDIVRFEHVICCES